MGLQRIIYNKLLQFYNVYELTVLLHDHTLLIQKNRVTCTYGFIQSIRSVKPHGFWTSI